MTTRKLSELPQSAGRDLLMDAEKRGIKALGGNSEYFDAIAVILIGLGEIISELQTK